MKSQEFKVKEIIWAKMGRYPWWPAQIKSIDESRVFNYEVIFLGDFTRTFLNK